MHQLLLRQTPQKSSKGILPWRDASCSLRSRSSADFSATASVSFVVVVALDGHDRFVGFTFLFLFDSSTKGSSSKRKPADSPGPSSSSKAGDPSWSNSTWKSCEAMAWTPLRNLHATEGKYMISCAEKSLLPNEITTHGHFCEQFRNTLWACNVLSWRVMIMRALILLQNLQLSQHIVVDHENNKYCGSDSALDASSASQCAVADTIGTLSWLIFRVKQKGAEFEWQDHGSVKCLWSICTRQETPHINHLNATVQAEARNFSKVAVEAQEMTCQRKKGWLEHLLFPSGKQVCCGILAAFQLSRPKNKELLYLVRSPAATYILWHSTWHALWHSIWHLYNYVYILTNTEWAYIHTVYVAWYLAFSGSIWHHTNLTFYLTCYLGILFCFFPACDLPFYLHWNFDSCSIHSAILSDILFFS